MARLIDADNLLEALGIFKDYEHGNPHFMNGIETARELVNNAPTVDAKPVRRGEWSIKSNDRTDVAFLESVWAPIYKCSICGLGTESYMRFEKPIMPQDADFWRYCPHCGAKMDGGKT